MPTPEIEEFAKILVRQVRDVAIQNCDNLLQPQAGSPAAKRWKQADGPTKAISTVIPDAIDETVFCLLQAIDEGLLRMKFATSDGKEIDLTEEGQGELSGWYMGSGGWRAMFSQERFIDDFGDLDQ